MYQNVIGENRRNTYHMRREFLVIVPESDNSTFTWLGGDSQLGLK